MVLFLAEQLTYDRREKHRTLLLILKVKKSNKVAKKKAVKKVRNPLFEAKARNFRIGGDIQHKRDMTRFVRWPKYILHQRQKRILLRRLKVPPTLNQFNVTVNRDQTKGLFKLLKKYAPETKKEKKTRLLAKAQEKVASGKASDETRPRVLKFGLNHVTTLVENKKAKLVVIASDVDPIELVLWLPQLCKKQDVPYCIVKNKERLGRLVN